MLLVGSMAIYDPAFNLLNGCYSIGRPYRTVPGALHIPLDKPPIPGWVGIRRPTRDHWIGHHVDCQEGSRQVAFRRVEPTEVLLSGSRRSHPPDIRNRSPILNKAGVCTFAVVKG